MMNIESSEVRLHVLNGQQKTAIKSGAKFVRKNFFQEGSEGYFTVSDGENLSGEKKDKLKLMFGADVFEERNRIKRLDEEWGRVLKEGDNLDTLRLAKESGMPKSPDMLERLFRKWRTVDENEYRLNWAYLCDYLPDFREKFGKERFMSLINKYGLCGDMNAAIEHARGDGMQGYEAEYLHFCYSHELKNRRSDERRAV